MRPKVVLIYRTLYLTLIISSVGRRLAFGGFRLLLRISDLLVWIDALLTLANLALLATRLFALSVLLHEYKPYPVIFEIIDLYAS